MPQPQFPEYRLLQTSAGCISRFHPYQLYGTGGLGKSSVNGLNHCIPAPGNSLL